MLGEWIASIPGEVVTCDPTPYHPGEPVPRLKPGDEALDVVAERSCMPANAVDMEALLDAGPWTDELCAPGVDDELDGPPIPPNPPPSNKWLSDDLDRDRGRAGSRTVSSSGCAKGESGDRPCTSSEFRVKGVYESNDCRPECGCSPDRLTDPDLTTLARPSVTPALDTLSRLGDVDPRKDDRFSSSWRPSSGRVPECPLPLTSYCSSYLTFSSSYRSDGDADLFREVLLDNAAPAEEGLRGEDDVAREDGTSKSILSLREVSVRSPREVSIPSVLGGSIRSLLEESNCSCLDGPRAESIAPRICICSIPLAATGVGGVTSAVGVGVGIASADGVPKGCLVYRFEAVFRWGGFDETSGLDACWDEGAWWGEGAC